MGTYIVRRQNSTTYPLFPSLNTADIQQHGFRLASTVFQHFVAADNASETFAGLKRIHGLMPYFMLKGVLKVSNPVSMIRGVHPGHACLWHPVADYFCYRCFGPLPRTAIRRSEPFAEVRRIPEWLVHAQGLICSQNVHRLPDRRG